MRLILSCVLALQMAAVGISDADVIYDNGLTANSGLFSDPQAGQLIADDFSLAVGTNVITDFHWTGAYGFSDTPTALDNFTIQIFNDAGGVPTITPFLSLHIGNVGRVDTGIDVFGAQLDLYSYSVDVSPIVLSPNTRYWLSIFNETTADANDNWLWGILGSAGAQLVFRNSETSAWICCDRSIADFELTGGQVPEPASLLLLALGLGALAYRHRQAHHD